MEQQEHSNKKQKSTVDALLDEMSAMSVETALAPAAEQGDGASHTWGQKSFAEAIKDPHPEYPTSFYMGEDDDREFDEFDSLCSDGSESDAATGENPPTVRISAKKYHSLFKPWCGALVLLLGKTVNFWVIEQRTRALWQLEYGFEHIDLEHGYYLACFLSRSDYYKVLEGGLWIILGHYLIVTKWRPKFHPSMETIHLTLVWVRFPELPLELFDEEILFAMGNTVGKAVKIDNTTLQADRGKYARVYVEVNFSAPLIPFITVLGCLQRVEYESLFLICFDCGKYGHRLENCPSSGKPPPTAATGPADTHQDYRAEGPLYGPWMMPANRSRPSRQRHTPHMAAKDPTADVEELADESVNPTPASPPAHGEGPWERAGPRRRRNS